LFISRKAIKLWSGFDTSGVFSEVDSSVTAGTNSKMSFKGEQGKKLIEGK